MRYIGRHRDITFPIRTDCVTILLVVAKGGNVRWNWHITPDLCLATSWLHDLIYRYMYNQLKKRWFCYCRSISIVMLSIQDGTTQAHLNTPVALRDD
jgi:hypothetical protein